MGKRSNESLHILLTQIIFLVLKHIIINKVMHKQAKSSEATLPCQSFAFCEIIPDQHQLNKNPAKGGPCIVQEQMQQRRV